jgi:hypothetical protein
MQKYDDTNTITLFNNKVEEGSNRPNVTGKLNWKGEVIEVALWKKESKNGTRFLSGKLQEPREKREAEPAEEAAPF